MTSIARAVREGAYMFWETLWPLILGFALAGAVQAFVPKDRMRRLMGDHGPASVARATALGMVSSSCSYAATAMARSLYQKGADFVTALVFMVASTNLVVELGIVLVVLLGWQFAAAEFVGGALMIVLLVVAGHVFLRQPARAATSEPDSPRGTWRDAAAYAVADLTMLRRELVVGYVVAGLLAVLVPTGTWNAVFLQGHGVLTSVENAVVGPLIAVVSFVCSVGNVALAAALWHGGISFGGVVAFVFADLITFPLLVIYRKYYGTRLAVRMFLVLWGVMSVGGLLVGGAFAAVHLVPATRTRTLAQPHLAWNYTTWLNIAFLIVAAVLYWAYRHRDLSRGFAIDPVCGMQVREADAPAAVEVAGDIYYFCSDHCAQRFDAGKLSA